MSWLGLVVPALAVATISSDQPLGQALPDLRAARVMFVEVAVEALSERFLAAAQMSHDDPAWSQRTRTYVSELWRVVDAAHAGGEVVLIEDPGGSLRVVVRADPPRQFGLVPPHPHHRAQVEASACRTACNWQRQINADGQTVELTAPLLGRFPQLMIDVMPWIHARLTGNVRQQALRPPARLIYALGRDTHH
jgi:hypothetical protein